MILVIRFLQDISTSDVVYTYRHQCFLFYDRMRLLLTGRLLCPELPFLCAPLITRLRNGFLVSDALFLGGLNLFSNLFD